MKALLTVLISLVGVTAFASSPTSKNKGGFFNCGNAPQSGWKTYYAVMGYFNSPTDLYEVEFGTFEGSADAGEEEPVNTASFETLTHNPDLAASSKEWRDASAFDISSEEHGQATLYIKKESFLATESGSIVRVKFKSGKELRLECGSFIIGR